ncbi:hypothetical protein [uncultured Tateyamaria sp.]|uniref:hypothetical protein n=1 Tax=uncultured Tateyamaria sp. TaxID=455651 RepID=UPI00262409FA|nr:hypothetical protein [uncultured Tateyamaria sp.]
MVGILAAVGTAVVTGLVSGAAKEAGGSAAGWVLGEIFGTPDTSQADAIKDLGDQLDSIATAVEALTDQLAEDMKMIQKELRAIEQEQLYLAWEIRDNDLQQYISRLNVQYKTFLTYAANPDSTSQQEVTNLVEEILDTNQGAKVVIAEVNTLLVGGGGNSSSKGVLQLWSEMTEPLIKAGKMSCYAALETYFQYYVASAYAQQRALYLVIEAYHQSGNDPAAQEARRTYQDYVKSQEIPFVQNIDAMLRMQLQGGVHAASSGKTYDFDYVKALQEYSSSGFWVGAYTPSATRARAERIITNSMCLADDKNRLVIWMIYPPVNTGGQNTPKSVDFNNVSVEVQVAGNEAGASYPPAYINDIVTNPVPGINNPSDYFKQAHYARRMVFEDLPGGSYVMKDKNGQDGLDPVSGSNQKTDYFQAPQYLTHQMILNGTVKGACLDFSIYADMKRSVYWT